MFGLEDGLMTSIGVILGAAHVHRSTIAGIAACVAVTNAMSMGAGTLFEDSENGMREATAMGAAAMVGTLLPALPVVLLPFRVAVWVTALVALGVAGVIGRVRGGSRADYLVTLATLAVVAAPTITVALALGTA